MIVPAKKRKLKTRLIINIPLFLVLSLLKHNEFKIVVPLLKEHAIQ